MEEYKYTKTCLCCKKKYGSNARGQRFCSQACQKRYSSKQKNERKFYSETKELMRIKARAHSLAVEIKEFWFHQQGLECECECCGASDTALEVHHKDRNFLNNTPENLEMLCKKCHAQRHSDAEKAGDTYNESFLRFVAPIMKSDKSKKNDK